MCVSGHAVTVDRPQNHQRVPTFIDGNYCTTVCIPSKSTSLLSTQCTRPSLRLCQYVQHTAHSISSANKFPWTTNLRCGASYTLPSYILLPESSAYDRYDPPIVDRHIHPTAYSYFKPSMVITETRAFNLRWPNIHLLSVVATASMSPLSSHDHHTFPLKKKIAPDLIS